MVGHGGVQAHPGGAQLLQQLWVAAESGHRANLAVPASAAAVYNGPEQEYAVFCSDSPNPPAAAYPALARYATARSGAVGPVWTWLTEPCSGWPGSSQDRYSGPWDHNTAYPVLVVGNTGDPATPYQDSVAISRLLGRARLLTVDGFGHTEALNPSTCAENYENRYLLTGALPPAGTVCPQNGQPFPA